MRDIHCRTCFILVAAALIIAVSLTSGITRAADVTHGFSPLHPLKYGPDFRHFDYVDPDAPKGGTLRLGAVGTFDSLNTLRYPGRTPLSRPEGFGLRSLLYDKLIVASADEPAGYYGLLAERITVAPDYSWVRFEIRPDARWHDGKPVTARDVVFTFETLARQGPPFSRQMLHGVRVQAEGKLAVKITAARPGNRDFVAQVGQVAIHPQHFWAERDVKKGGLEIPLGSGPYRVVKVLPGRKIALERVPGYWAAAHPVSRGRYNYDRIEAEFYRNNTVALEAFKTGAFDLRIEQDAVRWATGYEGPALAAGRIKQKKLALATPGHLMMLVFNMRRPLFKDTRVRRAISLAYDFSWTNRNLFHGQYRPIASFYQATRNAASGAASPGERKLLAAHVAALPDGILDAASPDEGKPPLDARSALVEAKRLLDAAGLAVRNGKRIDPASGEPVSVRIAYTNPRLPRVFGPFAKSLERLGITLKHPPLEPVTASKVLLGHDYDLAALDRWVPGVVPGTGEFLLWGSALADVTPSYALSGVKDAALDAAIKTMTAARSLETLQTAARAFDRILRWRQYAIPLWRSPEIWLALSDRIALPPSDSLLSVSYIDRAWAVVPGATKAVR